MLSKYDCKHKLVLRALVQVLNSVVITNVASGIESLVFYHLTHYINSMLTMIFYYIL
jgi:hypothetical protein